MISLEYILFIALAAAFVVLLVKKWGVAEWVQIHGNDFFSKLFRCDLCMSFWACVLCAAVLGVATDTMHVMLLPLFATPLTRLMV